MRARPLLLALLLAGAFAASLAACSPPRPPHPPTPGDWRIVVLSPALAVNLVHYGLDDLVVGRHAYDMVLDRSIPVCGDQAGIDYEALLRARPTHVLLEWGSRPVPNRLSRLAQAQRWEVRAYSILTIDELIDACADIHALALERADASADARTIPADPRAAFPSALAPIERPFPGRVLLLASTSPPAAVGPRSFHHQVLERLAGVPAIASGPPWLELDAEDLLRLAPDAIVLILPRAPGSPPRPRPTWDDLARRLGPIASLDIPAVRDRRILLLDDPLVLTPSAAMLDFTRDLRAALESWASPP